jgi:hypothetical protein
VTQIFLKTSFNSFFQDFTIILNHFKQNNLVLIIKFDLYGIMIQCITCVDFPKYFILPISHFRSQNSFWCYNYFEESLSWVLNTILQEQIGERAVDRDVDFVRNIIKNRSIFEQRILLYNPMMHYFIFSFT